MLVNPVVLEFAVAELFRDVPAEPLAVAEFEAPVALGMRTPMEEPTVEPAPVVTLALLARPTILTHFESTTLWLPSSSNFPLRPWLLWGPVGRIFEISPDGNTSTNKSGTGNSRTRSTEADESTLDAPPLAVADTECITFINPAAPVGEKFWGIRLDACPPPTLERIGELTMTLEIVSALTG